MKFNKIYIFLFVQTITVSVTSLGQDIHFSQFFSSPLTLNPANTGQFKEDWRVSAIHRQQWRASNTRFTSTALGADVNLKGGILNRDKVGIGLLLFNDKLGEGIINTNAVWLSSAYHRKLDVHRKHLLSLGAQVGYMQKRLNTSSLQFESQYQQYQYNSAIASGEDLSNNQLGQIAVNAGARYGYIYSDRLELHAGVSFFNVNTPKENFTSFNPVNDLNGRHSLQFGAQYRFAGHFTLYPELLLMQQSNGRYILPAAYLGYDFGAKTLITLYAGGMYRNKDAAILLTGLKVGHLDMKFSYDMTSSSLKKIKGIDGTLNNNRIGAWEISMILTGFVPRSAPRDFTVPCTVF